MIRQGSGPLTAKTTTLWRATLRRSFSNVVKKGYRHVRVTARLAAGQYFVTCLEETSVGLAVSICTEFTEPKGHPECRLLEIIDKNVTFGRVIQLARTNFMMNTEWMSRFQTHLVLEKCGSLFAEAKLRMQGNK